MLAQSKTRVVAVSVAAILIVIAAMFYLGSRVGQNAVQAESNAAQTQLIKDLRIQGCVDQDDRRTKTLADARRALSLMAPSARARSPQAAAFVVLVVNDLAPYRNCTTINDQPHMPVIGSTGGTGPTGVVGPTFP
jgi:hypothetical protein